MQTRCHLSVLIHEQAKKYGNKRVLIYRDFGDTQWKSVSWKEFSRKVRHVSNALLNIGVKVQENIGVFSQNSLQYLYTDFGAFGIRAVSVPFYATSSEQQIQYMIDDAQVRVLFVGEQEQYDKAFRVFSHCPSLERVIVFDKRVVISPNDKNSIYFDDFLTLGENSPRQSEVEKLYAEANEDDLCNILYTSGTTGDSKGVMLSYGQFHAALKANDEVVPVTDKDRIMNFLPITHIFERGWLFLCLSEGAEIVINTNPKEIQQSMRETHPTCMSSVPRFWEKVYAGVQEKINETTGLKKKLMLDAIKVGREHNLEYVYKGLTPPPVLHMKYKFYEKTIYSLLKKTIGIENGRFFPTAGAAIPPAVQEFVLSVGINMVAGYGLTESTATVACENDNDHVVGSVGRIMPHVQVRIGENNEIMLRGEGITHGYYKKEAATKAAFTEDGWFHTGDAGYIKDGHLFLTERIKDLFKTSNGKYIAPQAIEAKLVVDRYIDQISIIADERKFVSALIIPEYKLVKEYAAKKGIRYESMEELLQKPEIIDLFKERIDTLQQQFAHYEQIKRFTLLPHPFSMERGELTNTLKIKRNVLNKNYAAEIEKMYEE